MERYKQINDYNELKAVIGQELKNRYQQTRPLFGLVKQFVKDFLNNFDEKFFIEISNDYRSLYAAPPHIIPLSYNKNYIIKYNLIKILSEELYTDIV